MTDLTTALVEPPVVLSDAVRAASKRPNRGVINYRIAGTVREQHNHNGYLDCCCFGLSAHADDDDATIIRSNSALAREGPSRLSTPGSIDSDRDRGRGSAAGSRASGRASVQDDGTVQ